MLSFFSLLICTKDGAGRSCLPGDCGLGADRDFETAPLVGLAFGAAETPGRPFATPEGRRIEEELEAAPLPLALNLILIEPFLFDFGTAIALEGAA